MPTALEPTPLNLIDEMRTSYLDYAMSVIIGRALPDARDGLKPVHRRVLHAMNELGNSYNKPYKMSARIVGDVIGKYHPHGPDAVYDTIVRMVQDFSLRYPLIDGQGNFGSVDGDNPAAMRYTEVRMARLTDELLADIDKETVDFVPNYDGSLQEPLVLPAQFPNLLVNGTSGIAVGMATNVPPHNFAEVLRACIVLIDNPDASVANLMEKVKGPDFPLGGKIVSYRATLRHIYQPVSGSSPNLVMAYLYKHTDLQKNYAYNMTALVAADDGKTLVPRDGLSLKEIIRHFLDFRFATVRRRFEYQLRQLRKRIHILEGFAIIFNALDKAIRLIRDSEGKADAAARLIKAFGLDAVQADAVLDSQLYKIA